MEDDTDYSTYDSLATLNELLRVRQANYEHLKHLKAQADELEEKIGMVRYEIQELEKELTITSARWV